MAPPLDRRSHLSCLWSANILSYALDLHVLMPYHAMSKESRDDVWDDGLHFTPNGYGVMGEHIASRLVGLVRAISEEATTEANSKGAEE